MSNNASERVPAKPGQRLDLKAVVKPGERAAAKIHPADYWLSLLTIPQGKLSDKDVVLETKECFSCHQVGDVATREIEKRRLGSLIDSTVSLIATLKLLTHILDRWGILAHHDWRSRDGQRSLRTEPS